MRNPTDPKPRHTPRQANAARRAAARRQRRLTIGVVAAGLAVLVGVAVLATRGGPTAMGSGDPAHWALPSLGGSGEIRLADFSGKPTVVNFFASWCDQCRAELPGFARVSKELAGRVNFVGVNSLDDGQGLGMAKAFGIDAWPLARDLGSGNTGELHDRLGGQGMPITAFYDATGKLVDFADGALPEATLRTKLRALYGLNL